MAAHARPTRGPGTSEDRRVVVVTDGEQRSALAVARSLGAAGHAVHVTSRDGASVAGASRWARADHALPDALTEPAAFAAALSDLARRVGADLVLPMTEPAVLAVLAAPAAFADVVVPLPSLEQFRRISDKPLLLETARDVGIAVPRQWLLERREDWEALDATTLPYPLVLKPGRSVGEAAGRREKLGVRHAATAEQAAIVVRDFPDAAFPLLVQQRIVGPGVGIFLLRWDGEIRARFAHRRLREKPPAGGVSVYRESVPADPELLRRSEALLERFDWQGVAMIEFKLDAATGQPYAMEVNGRFWGSLQLAIDAGVDFPRLLCENALGRPALGPAEWRAVRSRWEWGEVDHILARLRGARNLPPDAPSLARALLDFAVFWRPGDRLEVCRASDLRPFLRESRLWWRRGR